MSQRTKIRLTLLGIVALTIFAGLMSWPTGPDINVLGVEREVKVHLGLDLQGGTSLLYKADVSEIPAEEQGGSLDGVRDVIERRINAFGVAEPNIQTVRTSDEWRILVELPGVTDITEAINRIGETPLLEFKKEGTPPELSDEEKEAIRVANEETLAEAEAVLARALAGEDFEALATEFSDDPGSKTVGGDLGEFSEGQMVPAFNDVIFNDANPVASVYPELVETPFGYHLIQIDQRNVVEEAVTTADAVEEGAADGTTDDSDAVTEEEPVSTASAHHILFETQSDETQQLGLFYEDTGLTGEQLERADVVFDQNTGLPTVSLAFNNDGRDMFAELTRDNIGKTIAIYLDGSPISTPVVQTEIANGEAIITGSFSLDEAKDLAKRLNAGALPVPVELISQQNVGPTLGQESVERSLFAGLLGLVLLAVFMIAYYRLPGLLATIALGIYFLLVLMVFKLWPVTLTLAGIAGFILSVGMAVDANVLIFERFKEEMRSGKPIRKSIEDGFKRAWTSIRDGNLSSLITCLILYWFGSSLIRGFAITLAIGIVLSMFSAIVITRTLMHVAKTKNIWWYGLPKKSAPTKK